MTAAQRRPLFVVVGAGIVGAAVARRLTLAGKRVRVVEREPRPGLGLSLRNSQVVHAGLYYRPGGLKARLCVEGRRAIYDYCRARPALPYSRCGKLVVANGPRELLRLESILRQATLNGVEHLRMLSASELRAMEPAVRADGALFSPESGIVAVGDLVRAFLAEVGDDQVETGRDVRRVRRDAAGLRLEFGDGANLRCDYLINCAGLGAHRVAASIEGFPKERIPEVHPTKGNYCSLQGPSPFQHLVYPVPSDDGGLGVHATLTLDQSEVLFGPDVEWTPDVSVGALLDYSSDAYVVPDAVRERFLSSIARYYPDIVTRQADFTTRWAAFRPRLYGEDAVEKWADFIVSTEEDHQVRGVVNLFGIESPGLTASMALADYVVAPLMT